MKRIGLAGLMFIVLLFTAQAVSAEGWPGCPWGYDHNPACVSGPDAAANAAAPKAMGLAQPAPVTEASEGWPGCPWCYRRTANAAAKPAGLAAPASVMAPEQGSPCGALSEAIYAAGYLSCVDANRDTSAAAKPIGLAAPVPAVESSQSWQDCPWGYPIYDSATHTFVSQCSTNVKVEAAAKPAGLAQPAPAPVVDREQSSHCASFAGPNYSICVVAASTALVAKPAGLAKPAPAATEETFVPCGFGERLDPLALACQ